MGDEQDSLRYLSLDGTCDVGRRIVWSPSGKDKDDGEGGLQHDEGDRLLHQARIEWDTNAVERCFGWPPELVQASYAWWSRRIHPDDCLRVESSLKRALFESDTARYWSETYRFRVYDGSSSASADAPEDALYAAASSSRQPAKAAASMISSGTPSTVETDSREAATSLHGVSSTPSSPPASLSRSPTPRQFSQLAPVAVLPASSASIASTSAKARSAEDSQYITVLDQLYISRQQRTQSSTLTSLPASSSSASASASPSNSERPHDRHKPEHRRNLHSHSHLPTGAVGALFALEQRIKTAEALHNPRSQLMRSISNISASSNASSSAATTSSSSNAAPASSTGSFVSVPSSAGAMQRAQQRAALSPQQLQRSNSHHESIGWNSAVSPTSPVSSPSTSQKAFSFLDVEGVRTILENTQSGLTMVDAKGRPTYFNAAGASITGYANLDELRAAGKDLHYALHHTRPDGREYPASECPIVRSMVTLTRVSNQPDTFIRKDGSHFPVVWSCSPISKLGKSIGAVLEFRDVTEEKALEKDKIKATLMNKHQEITIREANASKQRMTQFLDYIAHELRNPLHGIAANIEFLRDSLTALQLTYNNTNNTPQQRPGATPIQSSETTIPSGESGSLASTNSQSSSLRSSSGTSSLSSQHSISHGALRAMSPRLETSSLGSTSSVNSSALPSSKIPTAEIPSPALPPPLSNAADFPTLSVPPNGETEDENRRSQSSTPRGLVPADRSPGNHTEDALSALQKDASKAQALTVSKGALSLPQDKTPTPSKTIADTITSIDNAAQKQFQAHFEHSSLKGPPPWQAEDKKQSDNAGGAMAMSPLLADIAKHTATASALAKQQLDFQERRQTGHSATQVTSPSAQAMIAQRKSLASHPSTSREDLRSSSPASPSLSTATIQESEADTEKPHLSNTEIQQVLQTSQSFITSIRECVFHATHITNNVLDLSRFEAGKVELLNDIVYPARVATLAVDMMMARAQEKEIDLRLDIPDDLTLVRGDGTRLAQVFLNLLSNAIKFTPRNGQVTLRFRVSQEAGRVLLTGSIIDTGMGMSKAEMSNLFQRFGQSSRSIQAEYGGTGLGLSICQEIVTLQGGKMSVESEKGKGSTFSFTAYYQPASEEDVREYLRKTPGPSRRGSISPVSSPISEPGEASAAAAINAFIPSLTTSITGQASPSALPEDQQAKLKSLKSQLEAEQAEREVFRFKHILVAEDNGINQNIMKNYLKKLGYQYSIVNNGQEVLDTFVNKSHEVPIDVILMDCEMPVMDGRQATEHIRQHEHFRKNLVTPLDSPFNLQLGAAEINNLQATPPTGVTNISYSPPLASPASSSGSGGRRLHRTPIIGLSGNARQELVNQALASGMDDYVVKPFKLAELEKVLRKWEQTIDEQLVQRSIAVKAKEFLATAMGPTSPIRSKKSPGQVEDLQKITQWTRARSGSGSSKSDSGLNDGSGNTNLAGPGSPKPIRPPLLASLSASRLPREHMLGYGSPERASSRPKLPSRLSNEWIHKVSGQQATADGQSYTSSASRPRLESIESENASPAGMSPLLESPAPSPPTQVDDRAAALAPSLLEDIRPSIAGRNQSRESISSSPRRIL